MQEVPFIRPNPSRNFTFSGVMFFSASTSEVFLRTPSMYTAVKRVSAPRRNRLVALPGPPLRDISTPGRRASKSPRPVAPLRSMLSRSTMDTSATRSESGCSVRVAATTVSDKEGARRFCASTVVPVVWAWAGTDKAQSPVAARAIRPGRSDNSACLRAWGVGYFIVGELNQQTTRAGLPASVWVIRLRSDTMGRAQPPCWPVSGLAEHSPRPSQGLVQGPQWRV